MLQGANSSYNVAHVEKAVLFDEEDLQNVHTKVPSASGLPSAAGGLASAAGGVPSSAGGDEYSKLIGAYPAADAEPGVGGSADQHITEEGQEEKEEGEKEQDSPENDEERTNKESFGMGGYPALPTA